MCIIEWINKQTNKQTNIVFCIVLKVSSRVSSLICCVLKQLYSFSWLWLFFFSLDFPSDVTSKISREEASATSLDCVRLTSVNSGTCIISPKLDNRISLPILDSSVEQQYAKDARLPTVIWNCDVNTCDAPLDVNLHLQRSIVAPPGDDDVNSRQHLRGDLERREITVGAADQVDVVKTLCRSDGFRALADAYGDSDDD